MHLVYRAMEKEPVPTSLPNSLVPPSKRKKTAGALPGAVAVLPSVPGFLAGPGSRKESLRRTPPLSTSAVSISPKPSFRSSSEVCYCTNSLLLPYPCISIRVDTQRQLFSSPPRYYVNFNNTRYITEKEKNMGVISTVQLGFKPQLQLYSVYYLGKLGH